MTNVVNFTRPESEPDPDCVVVMVRDGKPEKWFRFACSFRCDDSKWTFDIWALNFEDAERRLKALRETAQVDGQLHSRVPA